MITQGNRAWSWFDNNLSVPVINQEIQKNIKKCVEHKCNIPIVCSYFNKVENFYGKMISYNKKGMVFESAQFYSKGTNIFFRIKNCVFENTAPEFREGLRTTSLAEVIRCEKIKGVDYCFYKTSVKYYEYY